MTTFLVGMAVGAALLAVLVKRREIRTDWFVVRMNVRRRWAAHRAERQQDSGLDIIPTPITALHSRRRPRDRRTVRRRRWADIHDVFPADEPLPEGPTLELAQWANDEANEKLADLPHFRTEHQQQ